MNTWLRLSTNESLREGLYSCVSWGVIVDNDDRRLAMIHFHLETYSIFKCNPSTKPVVAIPVSLYSAEKWHNNPNNEYDVTLLITI